MAGIMRAAGVVLLAEGHCLLQRRSYEEQEPLTWSVPGGMPEDYETPVETMVREAWEEMRIDLSGIPAELIDTHVGSSNFAFHTFLCVIPRMLEPALCRESVDAQWFRLGRTLETLWSELPYPLHSGLARLTRKPDFSAVVLSRLPRVMDLRVHCQGEDIEPRGASAYAT